MFKLLPLNKTVSYYWSNEYFVDSVPSFNYVYFQPVSQTYGGFPFIKNTGIFPESPMFAFPLCILLGYDVLNKIKLELFLISWLFLRLVHLQESFLVG